MVIKLTLIIVWYIIYIILIFTDNASSKMCISSCKRPVYVQLLPACRKHSWNGIYPTIYIRLSHRNSALYSSISGTLYFVDWTQTHPNFHLLIISSTNSLRIPDGLNESRIIYRTWKRHYILFGETFIYFSR